MSTSILQVHQAKSLGVLFVCYRERGFKAGCLRDRSRGYLLRSMRPVRCIFSSAAPGKAVELCSTPRKFFEKNLTKNFYLSPPGFCGGTRPCGTQEGGLSRAATHRRSRLESAGTAPRRWLPHAAGEPPGKELRLAQDDHQLQQQPQSGDDNARHRQAPGTVPLKAQHRGQNAQGEK